MPSSIYQNPISVFEGFLLGYAKVKLWILRRDNDVMKLYSCMSLFSCRKIITYDYFNIYLIT
jgi:hypothetical protein